MEESERYTLVLEKNLKLLEQNIALSEKICEAKEEVVKSNGIIKVWESSHKKIRFELKAIEGVNLDLMKALQEVANAVVDAKINTKKGFMNGGKDNSETLIILTETITETLNTYKENNYGRKENH